VAVGLNRRECKMKIFTIMLIQYDLIQFCIFGSASTAKWLITDTAQKTRGTKVISSTK
jgi:hypothetical protein